MTLNKKTFLINCIIVLFPIILFGQNKTISTSSDTLKIQAIPTADTIFINNQIKSDQFYDSLISLASRNKLTKAALGLILVNQNSKTKYVGIEDARNEEYYRLYTGKTIRNIEIIKLDVFGPTFGDTISSDINWVQNFGNKSHVKTRDFILKNNLFFQSGDSIDPAQLVDNERLLRDLDYIKDASIQIIEIPDSPQQVDILVITKDVYSAGAYIDLYNTFSGAVELYENNLAGIGHRFLTGIYYNTLENNPIGYSFNYRVGNIGNSFIKANVNYTKAFETERVGINLSRKFVSYNTKWAGSLNVSQTSTIQNIKKTDTILNNVLLNYATQDIWLGRSFLLKTNNLQYRNRTRIVLGARYINNTFYKGPEVSERYNFRYHDNQIALFSLAFARQKHFKSSLIYKFGKTEDIPIGTLIQLNIGPEKDEFYQRIYSGIIFAKRIYYPRIGYLNFQSEFGGHYYRKELEQGVLNIRAQAISNLHYFNSLKLRNFIGVNYTRGINRFPDEQIFINTTDVWGFNSDYIYGTQRLSLNAEIVAFSDLYLYNFRFLFFGFGDLGLIGPENESLFNQTLYSGLGIGFRVRNENLVFKTFQIKIAFYPVTPSDQNQLSFLLSGESYAQPIDFEPSAPEIIDFK